MKADPLKPSVALLAKLGSIIVHADEYFSPRGHHYDAQAFHVLMCDKEVSGWIKSMIEKGYLPVKRVKT